MAVPQPRACLCCMVVKDPELFPWGRSGRKRGSVCWECREQQAYAIDAARAARIATWLDVTTGVRMRRCSKCENVYPLVDGFHKGSGDVLMYYCKICQRKRSAAYHKSRVLGEEARLEKNRKQREWRARDKGKTKEYSRRYREKVMSDPVRHQRKLESQRMGHRLRREQKGLPVRAWENKPYTPERKSLVKYRLPSEPVVEFLDRLAVVREVPVGTVCEDLGISVRSIYRWRIEKDRIDFNTADRIIVRTSVDWETLWPREDYPEVYEDTLLAA